MPTVLTAAQIEFFENNGYLAPLRVQSEERTRECLDDLETYLKEPGHTLASLEQKVHLFFKWFHELSHSDPLLSIAKDLLGPDILVLASRFWIKRPGDKSYAGWHQDMAYFQVEPQSMITKWIALTEATADNGAMRFVPSSHRELVRHEETHDKNSLLSRGQRVRGVDESKAVVATLRPGEMSIHHGNLLHMSPPNASGGPRIGATLMMFPTNVRSSGERRSATLLCGEDRYHYWDHDPEPACDRDPVILDLMRKMDETYRNPEITQVAELAT